MENKVILEGTISSNFKASPTAAGNTFTKIFLNCPATVEENKKYNMITCIGWNEVAKELVEKCKKDDLIHVEGRLTTRRFSTSNGKATHVTNVRVEQFYKMNESHIGENNEE